MPSLPASCIGTASFWQGCAVGPQAKPEPHLCDSTAAGGYQHSDNCNSDISRKHVPALSRKLKEDKAWPVGFFTDMVDCVFYFIRHRTSPRSLLGTGSGQGQKDPGSGARGRGARVEGRLEGTASSGGVCRKRTGTEAGVRSAGNLWVLLTHTVGNKGTADWV